MDTAQQIREWQQILADPNAAPDQKRETMRLAIQYLRADRKMAVEVGAIKKEKKVPKNAKALLEDFANQMAAGEK